jgi:hypothetical protein
MPLGRADRSLFRQWALLLEVGARNRRRGFRPEPLAAFLARSRREQRLIPSYPPTA